MKRELKFREYHDKIMRHFELYNAYVMIDINNVMQFTGLKDKNGKEIYEGDIVKCASNKRCPHEVVWMEEVPSCAILGGGMPGFYLSGFNEGYAFLGEEEIIGNIHENPELLK